MGSLRVDEGPVLVVVELGERRDPDQRARDERVLGAQQSLGARARLAPCAAGLQGDDGDGDGILGRIFNADGSPAGGEFVINATVTGNQEDALLEIEGDDVDLGTDLKVRYQHSLVAEFRRDAVDGWWFKSFVLNEGPPYGGEGNATDVGDVSTSDRPPDPS